MVVKWDTQYLVSVFTSYGSSSGEGWYKPGSIITVSISSNILDHGNGTRRIFKGWYEDGSLVSDRQSFSITVDKPRSIVAGWDTEYEVKVFSEKGVSTGSGWYRKGTTATISISPTLIDKDFFSHHIFGGWEVNGIIVSKSPTYSLYVDQPVTLVASWKTEPKIINTLIILGPIISMAALATLTLSRRRKRPPPLPPKKGIEEEIKKYEEYLEKLEQLRKEEKVSEQAYEKLRGEYEKKLEELIGKLKK
jgi:hypothetical protein